MINLASFTRLGWFKTSGLKFYKGPSIQYSFVKQDETLLGGGLWFDY